MKSHTPQKDNRPSFMPHFHARTALQKSIREERYTPKDEGANSKAILFFTFFLGILSTSALGIAIFWYAFPSGNPPVIQVEGAGGEMVPLSYGEDKSLSDPDFFTATKKAFIDQKVMFIEADLSAKILRLYKDGEVVEEVPIVAKGKEGSWWETPAGVYAIQSKEENHFSSFGQVNQPWSMAFQGNFFIHGVPTYPDGKEVASNYSGGCIRLDTKDAERIYNLAKVGTPVIVFEKDFLSDGFTYDVAKPDVSALGYLVADIKSHTVLVAKDVDVVRPIASVTKLITALVAAEHINLDKNITVSPQALVETSVPRLKAGQKISAYGLLFPLLEESSNEAAEAYAYHVGRNRFIELMNQKAAALNMEDSHFADVSGADADNVSTPNDLFRLAQYVYNNRSFLLGISSGEPVASAYEENPFGEMQNFNLTPETSGFVGGKIGKTTAAGETAVLLFDIKTREGNRPIVVVLLGSNDKNRDTKVLLEHVAKRYQIRMAQ